MCFSHGQHFWHLTQLEQNHNYLLPPWMTTFYSNPWAIDQLWHLQSCAATIQPLQLACIKTLHSFLSCLLRSAVLSPPRRWCVTGYYITAEADFPPFMWQIQTHWLHHRSPGTQIIRPRKCEWLKCQTQYSGTVPAWLLEWACTNDRLAVCARGKNKS